MKDLLVLLAHLLTTIAKLPGPGVTRAVVADSQLMKQKYRLLYSAGKKGKPGPKGPSKELVEAIVELKQRNPRFGCRRIAQQVADAFGVDIDKDQVRRVLAKHYRPTPGGSGPSWLTFLGHMKDSLWSIDLFRCESIHLKSHWVLVVMDQFTRRIIGFGVHAGDVDGVVLCRLFNTAISAQSVPHYLSSDNDPLFRTHRMPDRPRARSLYHTGGSPLPSFRVA